MQRNVLLLVAYDGTGFHGWQSQAGQRTVQSVVEHSLMRVVRHPVNLIGCSRTDAGVHARGHVSNFRTDHPLDVGRFRHAIGSRLPADLSVIALRDVRSDFHATRSAISKLYEYRIHNASHRPVEDNTQRYAYHFWQPLDECEMQHAASYFVGTLDFRAMASRAAEKNNTVRTVLRCDVERCAHEIRVSIEGTGFLYNQVRNMVGTLVNVGRGHWQADRVPEILAGLDRTRAGQKVPAHGLTLCWVKYPPELLRPSEIAPEQVLDVENPVEPR